jgi:hypothetical protein
MGRLMLMAVMAGLVEANQELGASVEEAFILAFTQVLLATPEELELLAHGA